MTVIREVTVDLAAINCGACGGVYAINERYREKRQEEGNGWHCPYCEVGWGYHNNGENARLKRELEEKSRQLVASKCETLSERHAREKAERKLKRVQRGVCPCCNRTFQNLQRHMATEHPDAPIPKK